MREQGVITKGISGNIVEVAFERSPACEKCKLCHDLERGMVGVEAVNNIGAKREDIVEIEIPSAEIVKGSIVVFLIPIFFLVAGYLTGAYLVRLAGWGMWEEGAGITAGILAMFLSYFAIRWYDGNIAQKEALRAEVVKIISSR